MEEDEEKVEELEDEKEDIDEVLNDYEDEYQDNADAYGEQAEQFEDAEAAVEEEEVETKEEYKEAEEAIENGTASESQEAVVSEEAEETEEEIMDEEYWGTDDVSLLAVPAEIFVCGRLTCSVCPNTHQYACRCLFCRVGTGKKSLTTMMMICSTVNIGPTTGIRHGENTRVRTFSTRT